MPFLQSLSAAFPSLVRGLGTGLPALLLVAASSAQTMGLINPGFEEGATVGIPLGWAVYPEREGNTAGTLIKGACAGQRSAFVQSTLGGEPDEVTYLYQWLDAKPMRGKRYVFRGALRMQTSNPDRGASLRVKILMRDGTEQLLRAVEPNVTDRRWRHQRVILDVPPKARDIMFAVCVEGTSQAFADDLSLQLLGAAGGTEQAPLELNQAELTSLLAFARLLGYVRHFHPSDQVEEADWHALAIDGVRRLASLESSEALATALEELFVPLGATIQVFPTDHPVPPHPALTRPEDAQGLRVYTWKHRGYGRSSQGLYASERRSESARKAVFPEDVYERELPGGVTCRVPLALWGNFRHTFPAPESPWINPAATGNPNDRGTRLAALLLAWNVLQHFYPYFDVTTSPWEGSLEAGLRKAAVDRTPLEFQETLQLLVAKLDDSHGEVRYGVDLPRFGLLPFTMEWIEDSVIVTRADTAQPEPRPHVGDEVLEIDGESIDLIMERQARRTSAASERVRRDRVLLDLLLKAPGEASDLLLSSPEGLVRECTVEHQDRIDQLLNTRPRINEIEPGILYVDISRLQLESLAADIERMSQARGVVFDLRGYPSVGFPMARLLTGEPLQSPTWRIPEPKKPDREELTWNENTWPLPPADTQLTGKVAYLISSIVQSAAETNLSFIEAYKLAALVGEPTAGTNGNVNTIDLPGGYTVRFTGMRVLKQDGSEHHGIGIQPTHPVSRTRQGVIEGRDEVLEAAVELVR